MLLEMLAVTSLNSPSAHQQQQQQPHQLMTPTKSEQHVDDLRQQHCVVKPFKSPRRKWSVT